MIIGIHILCTFISVFAIVFAIRKKNIIPEEVLIQSVFLGFQLILLYKAIISQ